MSEKVEDCPIVNSIKELNALSERIATQLIQDYRINAPDGLDELKEQISCDVYSHLLKFNGASIKLRDNSAETSDNRE